MSPSSRGAPPPKPTHTIELADGAVHVHLRCGGCTQTAWDHQQVAWLADEIAQRLASLQVSSSSLRPELSSSYSKYVAFQADAAPRPAYRSRLVQHIAHASTSSPPLQSITSPTPAPAPAPAPAPKVNLGKKGPRTRTGCFTCRMKRVKCDEVKPICTRCKRNPERHCVYPRTSTDTIRERELMSRPKALATGQTLRMETPPPQTLQRGQPPRAVARPNRQPGSSLLRSGWTGPSQEPVSLDQPGALSPILPDQFGLFLDGITYISSPGLLNAHPTKPGARARGDRVLAKLWEAQMFISAGGASGALDGPMGTQAALAAALVSVTWSLGAVARAFEGTRPTEVHDDMIARSRRFVNDAAEVIHAYNRGEGFNEPETMLILFEMFLLRDCGSGDPLWAKTHSLLRAYARKNGGPRKMVQDNRAVQFGNSLYEQHLVYLAVYDTFAALSLGLEPYFVQPQKPGERQWIEDVASAQQVIQSDFGMSLHSVFSVAGLAKLLAERPNPASPHNPTYLLACHAMYEELETVALATIYSSPAPIRVQFGDLLIRHALICQLQRVAFGRPAEDTIVQRSAAAIMELLAEVAIHTGSMVNLMYPMLVVTGLVDKAEQERLQLLIDFAKVSSGLVELHRLQGIAYEAWRRKDAGEEELRMTDIFSESSIILIL